MNEQSPFTLETAKKINSFVSYNESLDGNVGIHGVNYTPSIPIEKDVVKHLEVIMNDESITTTHRALKYMYYAMRTQIFWDGNKRTALISANYIMRLNGNGIVHIDESHLEVWNELLSEFYETNNDEKLIEWTYKNCIFCIDY